MANNGPNTNGCQFYISTIATPWLDGTSTIFGKVVKGAGYVHTIEKVGYWRMRSVLSYVFVYFQLEGCCYRRKPIQASSH